MLFVGGAAETCTGCRNARNSNRASLLALYGEMEVFKKNRMGTDMCALRLAALEVTLDVRLKPEGGGGG